MKGWKGSKEGFGNEEVGEGGGRGMKGWKGSKEGLGNTEEGGGEE